VSKEIYNSPFIGGEVEIETERDPQDNSRVIITYRVNGEVVTKEEAQALMDEGRRRAQH
jgi:hypothetical protein